jgi:hypothetical protein
VILFGLALVPVTALLGLALDFSRGSKDDTKLQQATDAAALAAVAARVPTVAKRQEAALAMFTVQAPNGVSAKAIPVSISSTQATIRATGVVATTLMKVAHHDKVGIAAEATAVKVFEGPPPCVLALNRNVNKAINITGSSAYTAKNCTLHSNSSAMDSLAVDNNASVNAANFCAVGETAVPPSLEKLAYDYCEPVEDPFRNLQDPPSGSCKATNLEVTPKQTVTLTPGTYCGGLTLKGTVTLNPGVYVISGRLTITSQATVKGAGVTFYLTGANAGFTIDGQGGLELTAPTEGDYAGILFFQDRYANQDTTSTFVGDSTTKIMGSIYMPTQKVRVAGSSSVAQDVPFLPIIADQVEITGSIKATSQMPAGMNLPFPLPKTESGVRLVK